MIYSTFKNVRTRLTLWNVAVMGVLLTLFAAGTYSFVRESMFAQIDTRLAESLAILEATARTDIEEIGEIERHTRVLAFRVQEGEWPLYVSGGWIAGDLDAAGERPESGRWIFVSPRAGLYHIQEKDMQVGDRRLLLSVAEENGQLHLGLNRLRWTLLAGLPIALLLALGAGYLLAGRALSPIQQLTRRAMAISAENLSERLPVPNPHDELGQLTVVLNDAFARLEESFGRLRRFTHDAAHELRTPLTILRSVGEVGLQNQTDIHGYRDVIGSMLEEVQRLGRLVDGLLTLARSESGRYPVYRKPESILNLVREVVDCLRVLTEEKGQILEFDSPIDANVLVDRDILRLALLNLVANAIQYTQIGGKIRVSLSLQPGNRVVIDVEDNGPGIQPEHRERIFERFYRVDASRSKQTGGSGLGLAIARWAVATNEGQLTLESNTGPGCRFRVELPCSDTASVGLRNLK